MSKEQISDNEINKEIAHLTNIKKEKLDKLLIEIITEHYTQAQILLRDIKTIAKRIYELSDQINT